MGGLAGCGPNMPAAGVPQSNEAQQGVVIGLRKVAAKFPAMAVVGGADSVVEHAAVDAASFEYIIRKANDDLVSVTQSDRTPLALWQNVRVVAGSRARVVPDHGVSTAITAVKPKVRLADPQGEETSVPVVALQP